MKTLFTTALVAALGFSSIAHAGVVNVIDFGEFANGDAVTSATSSGGLVVDVETVANPGGFGPAVAFDTNNAANGDFDLEAPVERASTGDVVDLGNVLIIPDDLSPLSDSGAGGTITFDFGQAITFNSIDVIDAGSFEISFLDAAGDVFESSIFSATGLDTTGTETALFDTFTFNLANVYGIIFDFGPSSISSAVNSASSGGIDNLVFEVAEVPIPGAIPLLLTGIAGLRVASRKKKKA